MKIKLRLCRNGLPVTIALLSGLLPVANAQGIPLPGQNPAQTAAQSSAPVPGANPAAPVPGRAGAASQPNAGSYQQLPLSPVEAQSRIEELKSLLPEARPQDIQEAINHMCEWLADIADAHWRLHLTFAKNEATRVQSDAEKQAALKFSQLKNQAQLLKADLLIKQQRYPEALGPLVEIVVAEPRSATGQAAYKRLKDIGFAQEPEGKQEAKADQPKSSAPVNTQLPQPDTTTAPGAQAKTLPAPAARPLSQPAAKPVVNGASSKPTRIASKAQTTRSSPQPKRSSPWLSGSPFGSGHRSSGGHR